MKYARLERERRFLVAGEPPPPFETRTIEDRYLQGTRMRLRKVTVATDMTFKLGQQEDVEPGVKRVVTIYLTNTEYALFATLSGITIVKTRALCHVGEEVWAIDTYPDGLRIAEREGDLADIPSWAGREITGDPTWSGAALSGR